MDLRLSEEQEMMRKTVKELAAKEIAPIAEEIDQTGRFPKEVMKKMADAGLFGMLIPPPFGGSGSERLNYSLALEEIAAASASVAWCFAASVCVGFAILALGTERQRQNYLPSLAKGEKLGGVANTEPEGGTNWMMTLQTKAVISGDDYVVNGSKCFITNAGEADVYIVSARTDPSKGPMGISTLIIDKDTPGFSFGKLEDKMGLRADPTGELIFEDCHVPKENLLGQEGDGVKNLQAAGALDCAGQPAVAAGIARAALEASINYTKQRVVVGPNTLANFEAVQCTIADMAAAVEALKLLSYRGAFPEGQPDPLIFMNAILSRQIAMDVTSKAVELHGCYGCTKGSSVERYFRDAKTFSSAPPVSAFIRAAVGKMLLGIPTGPPPGAGGPPPGAGGPPK